MNFIKEFAGYSSLPLPKGIILSDSERIEMCKIISNAIKSFYSLKAYSKIPIVVDGISLNPEYLSKAVNNRTLLKKIAMMPEVRNKEDLFNFVKSNLYELFNTKGKYFSEVYSLLSNTSKRGHSSEETSFRKFEDYANSVGLNIQVKNAFGNEDKYGGVDGFFIHNGKRFTIQVKPLFRMEEYKKDITKYIVFCDGTLTDLKTDYLIVTNERETKIFRSRGTLVYPSNFLIPKENLISESK